ncbi:hypothetical protein LTR70_010199 [Exophiala xenobiotica]|uniref:Fatty acid hydroxylase domain-containing protein n=1 Tax=Lithohypha guttulata TaxID=1690604 RepID=A0ABR0JUP5_9EURO|nr:hypothetical protein LTR24_010184 [Lithohypha guttulata]KAK5309544.1 hypothetical protein LTR70_010199 [Exophiala xenobiotica]
MSNKIATVLRVAIATVVGSAIVFPALYQPSLDHLWAALKSNAFYQASTFETFWTVLCYAVIEPLITVVFLQHPEWRLAAKHKKTDGPVSRPDGMGGPSSRLPQGLAYIFPPLFLDLTKKMDEPASRPHGMRRPASRLLEGLTYIVPLLLLDLTMIKKFAGVPLEAMLSSGNYDPALARSNCGGNTCQVNFLMPSVHNFSFSSPLQTQRALPDVAPSSRRLALELVASFVIYDAAFFAFHLAMHVLPGIRLWHAPHHTHAEIHPQVTNQLHIFERMGLVLLANFSLNIIRSHVLTRTLFVPLFVWLLVEIHSGLDLPWGYEKVLPRGWGGGARKHARHHAGGEGGLEPYFEWCDGALEYGKALLRSRQPSE